MKISVLTPDMSHNCIGRAYILVKVLQRKYEVGMVGPVFGKGIWEPVADDANIKYKFVKLSKNLSLSKIKVLYKKIDGDIIYASKPLFTSFGIGLIKKFFTKKPLILDIDDWELGFKKEYLKSLRFKGKLRYLFIDSLFHFLNNNSYWNILLLEKLIGFADKISVSNCFLKNKYGGTIIYHGRDENYFNPENFSRSLLRKKHRINDRCKVIMFFGTPNPHKGIEVLIDAISLNKSNNILFVIAGMAERNYCKDLIKYMDKKIPEKIKIYGLQSFMKIPEFLSIADIIIIPQQKNYSSIGQVPAKVFDAMAMAKPIIATNVSDLPSILDNCGLIVESSDPEKLNEAINYILSNPEEAEQMGLRARKKLINKYSWNKMEEILVKIIEEVRGNHY